MRAGLVVFFLRSRFYSQVRLPQRLSGEESAFNAGDVASVPGSGRSPREGNGNLLEYSCQENPMDRGAQQATVLGVVELDTTEQLNNSRL